MILPSNIKMKVTDAFNLYNADSCDMWLNIKVTLLHRDKVMGCDVKGFKFETAFFIFHLLAVSKCCIFNDDRFFDWLVLVL